MNITKRVRKLQWAKQAALSSCLLLLVMAAVVAAHQGASDFKFALLGDRTGEAQPGVYEEAWREAAAENPTFVLTVGDTIQGGNDATLDDEWQRVFEILAPFHKYKLFLTPGNHDVWDADSAAAFEKYSHHPLHYSFDWQQAHFTVLDDSESDQLKPEEMAFLENDLAAHQAAKVKFIVSHRPSWLFPVVMRNPAFPLHQLALKYGVKYVIAGHIHQMLHFDLDGVTYLCMASSGGHLRNDKAYEHGWFFQHTVVEVNGSTVQMAIKELKPPFGTGRVTSPSDWGAAGLQGK